MQRRLAAIMAADVFGYSRLMGADEVGTLTALKGHRRELADPCIAEHHGRIVKTTGDGILVEFASVVDAVACAVTIQRGMVRRNVRIAKEKRIVFRIGINVGDIIIDGHDIFGDGVNIAARLETLCEPGGVCISRAANDQVRDKLFLSFADMGEQAVKNIARAVGIFGLGAKEIVDIPETIGLSASDESGATSGSSYEQEIHYCQTKDGVQLAYSRVGSHCLLHPELVTHLILLGGYPQGWKKRSRTAAEKEAGEAMITLMRVGWGQENPAFRQMFTSQFVPDASKGQAEWFNELQRISTSPEDAVRNLLANGEVDITQLLPQVKARTLVMHAWQDARVPFEMGRRLAAGIPGARFVPLESRNHIILDTEPAFDRFMDEAKAFIAQ
jgi:class 3 adenylate cyclase